MRRVWLAAPVLVVAIAGAWACASAGNSGASGGSDAGAGATHDAAGDGLHDGGGGTAGASDSGATGDTSTDATPEPDDRSWAKIKAPDGLVVKWLSGSAPDDVWAAGDDAVYRYDGKIWKKQSVGTGNYRGVWAGGKNDAWVISWMPGNAYHLTTAGWQEYPFGVTTTYDIAGLPAGDVWLGMQWNFITPALHRFSGGAWQDFDIGTQNGVYAIWVNAANDVWGISESRIFHHDGVTLSERAAIDAKDIWGSGPGSAWIVDETGSVKRWDGTAFSTAHEIGDELEVIWGSGEGDVWVGGASAFWHFDGSSWKDASSASWAPGAAVAIWGSGKNDIWVSSGEAGVLYHLAVEQCPTGRGDCDGNSANGCEVDLETDAGSCGGCGFSCPGAAYAAPACSAGNCSLTCSAGYGNCNQKDSDGCETDLATNAMHCGACSNECSDQNATASCESGVCKVACKAGFLDCNSSGTDGCECGGKSSTPTCSGTKCNLGCSAGTGDCDGNTATGCETTLLSLPKHCGACNNACATAAACVSGVCGTTPTVLKQGAVGNPIAVDATHYYSSSSSAVSRTSKSGGSSQTIASSGAEWIALDATHAFFAHLYPGTSTLPLDSELFSVPLAGGTKSSLAGKLGGWFVSASLGPADLYVILDHNGVDKLHRVAKSGGALELVATLGQPTAVATDATSVYYAVNGELLSQPHAGGTPKSLYKGSLKITHLLVLGAELWFVSSGLGAGLEKLPITGGTPTHMADYVMGPLATDGTSIFYVWVDGLAKVSSDGTHKELANPPGQVHGIAADSSHVYWTTWQKVTTSNYDTFLYRVAH